MASIHYTDNNPYLDDAVPCPDCGKIPHERIGRCDPFIICGIPVNGAQYGTYLVCGGCGKRTLTFSKPWEAYLDWNRKNIKPQKEGK